MTIRGVYLWIWRVLIILSFPFTAVLILFTIAALSVVERWDDIKDFAADMWDGIL